MTKPVTVALAVVTALLTGCAAPAKRNPQDPLERINRPIYKFNDSLDRALLKPAAKGYRYVTPDFVETGVSNFFDNLGYPTVIVNDLLQGKVTDTFKDTGRFLINTTIGIGGLLDPATPIGLQENDEDFGQTFGKWGWGNSTYLMLPLLGPSTVRDAFGNVFNQGTSVTTYVDDTAVILGVQGLGLLDTRARLLSAEGALEGAYDRYALLRSVYLQRRNYQIHDGDVPEEDLEAELLKEAEAEDDDSAAPAPKTDPKTEPKKIDPKKIDPKKLQEE